MCIRDSPRAVREAWRCCQQPWSLRVPGTQLWRLAGLPGPDPGLGLPARLARGQPASRSASRRTHSPVQDSARSPEPLYGTAAPDRVTPSPRLHPSPVHPRPRAASSPRPAPEKLQGICPAPELSPGDCGDAAAKV
ncbi:hypothetical protein NN561_008373 [Cricetulus griseus]